MMVHEGVPLKTVEYKSETKFADWPIEAKLKSAIKGAGWEYPHRDSGKKLRAHR